MKILIFYIILIAGLFFASCGEKTNKNEGIDETDIIGLYSGKNNFGWQSTLDLQRGGYFTLEGYGVGDGDIAFGRWTLDGSKINFYVNGNHVFSGYVVDDRNLRISGNNWKKIR